MIHKKINLTRKTADGYIIPCGGFNIVVAVTDEGMVGCGAFDIAALDRFNYPAARVKPRHGNSVNSLDDLLEGIVKDVNVSAGKRIGITVGMSGKEALEKM